MVPFSHGELVKKCMISTIEKLFPIKPELKTAIEKVPLGRNTFTRGIEDIGEELTKSTLQDVMNCESISLALDETNDIRDTAQLAVFVRYYSKELYHERLLTLLNLKGRATGAIIFDAYKTFMIGSKIPWNKIVGFATDGAPAMERKALWFCKRSEG